MRILVTGGTGFVGRALCLRLGMAGHSVCILTRNRQRACLVFAAENNQTVNSLSVVESLAEIGLETRIDAVVNLAGAAVASGRWTASRKRLLRSSRIENTRRLVDWLAARPTPPACLVSASAVGYYGMDRGEEVLSEMSAPGEDFLALLAQEWEAEATRAASENTRVGCLRIGVVLGHGGALAKMKLPFRLCLGGRLGSGQQWFPWLHLDDLLAMILRLLADDSLSGAFNAVAPKPVRNDEFTRALGRAMRCPTIFPVPALGLKIVFGEMAEMLLGGQQAIPTRFSQAGFTFAYPELATALAAIFPQG